MNKPIIVLGADHAAVNLKTFVGELLRKEGYRVEDVGTFGHESVDYPDYAEKVGEEVARGRGKVGILACGTGIGASIAANKVPGVRAALVADPRSARLSREHNDANVLVLAGRPYRKDRVRRIVKAWLQASFLGGRHLRRVRKIARMERRLRENAV
jgi:RpiB/LacA/LacB family sugar-phosphate isomerase